MRGAEKKLLWTRSPERHHASQLIRFHSPSTTPIFIPRKTSAIWRREKPISRIFFLLFIFCAALVAYVSLAIASPPPSRGARPLSLGNGYTAVAGDPYGLFYNPATLFEVSQKEIAIDYGRSFSVDESARSDFNYLYAKPHRIKDKNIPVAIGFYGESPAKGAHIIDVTLGGGMDAPVDVWTKGFMKWPVRLGGAVTLRKQQGSEVSNRVGGSKLGLGMTAGAFIPFSRVNQMGITIRNFFLGNADPDGASLNVGVHRHHSDLINVVADLSYGSGGIWRFGPGVELLFARGVLRPRLGWGFRDTGGIDSIATGVGVYLSPIQLDIAYLIPTTSLTDNMEQFRVSFNYRFGNPQFSEVYYDRALEQAGQLDKNVLNLKISEAELKASLAELEQKKRIAQEELKNAKGRIESLKERDLLGQRDNKIRQLESRINQLQSELAGQRIETKTLREKKATVRVHVVQPGDTLQSLAKEYYGDPNQWKKIYGANTDKIDRGLPRVGARLVIP